MSTTSSGTTSLRAAIQAGLRKRLLCKRSLVCRCPDCPCEFFQESENVIKCGFCGGPTQRAGSCRVCTECGETTGCS